MADLRSTREALGQGLLTLGLLGVGVTSTFLALNWAAYEDRSDTVVTLLVASLAALGVGGLCLRSVRLTLLHLLAGGLLAATFVAAMSVIARYRSTHFFPPRSRTLLESSLACVLAAGVALLVLRRGSALARARRPQPAGAKKR